MLFLLRVFEGFLAAAFWAFFDMGCVAAALRGLLRGPSFLAFLAAAPLAFFFAAFLSTIAIGCAGSSLVISSLILTSAATFALMSAASPAALACLTASPAASHCLTRASMLAGAAELSKLLPPASVLAMRARYSNIAAHSPR